MSNSLGEMEAPLTMGFGLHWAWVYATMFATTRLFLASSGDASSVMSGFYLLSMAALSLTLFLFGFNYRRSHHILQRMSPFVCGTISTISTFALLAANSTTPVGITAFIVASMGTGIGSALLLLLWGEYFSRKDTPTATINSALGVVVAIFLYVVLVYYLPPTISCVLVGLLPMLEALILRGVLPARASSEVPSLGRLRVRTSSFALRIGVSTFIFGVALGVLRNISLSSTFTNTANGSQGILLAAAVFAAPILICIILVLNRYEFGFLYRPLVVLIAMSLLLIPFFGSNNPPIVSLVILVGYVCFEVMMWVVFSEISFSFRLSSILVYGVGRASLTLGTLLCALLLPPLLARASTFAAIGETGAALIAMCAMVLGYCLLPREKDIGEMVISDGAEESPTYVGKEIPPEWQKRRFALKCQTVADQYLLSKREAEVLYLLAKGRNASYIKDELFISEGTAKTHIWRIYRKLDVHTQQDLIDLVDRVTNQGKRGH